MAKKSGNGYKLNRLELYEKDFVKDERDGINVGLANGLKLTHFINELFYANYKAQLTDEELLEAIVAEYPNRETIQPMGSYRAYFNANVHGFGTGETLTADEKLRQVKPEKEEKPKKTAAKKSETASKKGAGKKKAAKK